MTAGELFYASDGGLRAPWRLLVFAVAAFGGLIVAQGLVSPMLVALLLALGVRGDSEFVILSIGLLLGHVLALRWIDKRPWSAVMMGRSAARPSLLGRGALFGAAAIGLPTLLLIGVGWLRLAPAAAGNWWTAAGRLTTFLAPAAFWEELAFRGYLFMVLREWRGDAVALGVTSAAFGAVHLLNAGATAQSTALVVLAGIFLGAVMLATSSLYAAWMAHLAWNWTMAVVFHVAVSGIVFAAPNYALTDNGPDWATGGQWGPEGGAAAALGMGGGLMLLALRRRRAEIAGNTGAAAEPRGVAI